MLHCDLIPSKKVRTSTDENTDWQPYAIVSIIVVQLVTILVLTYIAVKLYKKQQQMKNLGMWGMINKYMFGNK